LPIQHLKTYLEVAKAGSLAEISEKRFVQFSEIWVLAPSFFYYISTMKLSEAGGCLNEFENLVGTHFIQYWVLDVFLGSF
jgi:hypothetical protein